MSKFKPEMIEKNKKLQVFRNARIELMRLPGAALLPCTELRS